MQNYFIVGTHRNSMGWQTVRDQYELLAVCSKPQGGNKCQGEGDGWMDGETGRLMSWASGVTEKGGMTCMSELQFTAVLQYWWC